MEDHLRDHRRSGAFDSYAHCCAERRQVTWVGLGLGLGFGFRLGFMLGFRFGFGFGFGGLG